MRSGLGRAGRLSQAWEIYGGNCDLFWGKVVARVDGSYRVATVDQALAFAWEVRPDRCMELRGGRLPFGFHAWARYDLSFLKPHLLDAGVEFPEEMP